MGIKDIVKPFGSQSFLVGIGVAAAAYFIGPQIKEALRPMAVKGAQGVMAMGSMTAKAFGESKDKVSHMLSEKSDGAMDKVNNIAEVKSFQDNIIKELKEEREISNKILQDLANSIFGLKEELMQMRNTGIQQNQ